MKTYKERYRRLPIELLLSPEYEGLPSDGKLVFLTLYNSPRQTPPGIYEGTDKALQYETSLDGKRLKIALTEVEKAGMIESIPKGGWWVKIAYRYQSCDQQYEKSAIRHLKEKWPEILDKFLEYNAGILGRKDKGEEETDSGEKGDSPPSDTSATPTDTEAVPDSQNTDNRGSGSDSGSRGLQGKGGGDAPPPCAIGAQGAASPPTGGNKSNGEIPTEIFSVVDTDIKRVALQEALKRFTSKEWNVDQVSTHLRAANYDNVLISKVANLFLGKWEKKGGE